MQSVSDVLSEVRAMKNDQVKSSSPSVWKVDLSKKLYSMSDSELESGILQCQTCNGTGKIKYDVQPSDYRFGKMFPCPGCKHYQEELARRKKARELTPIIEQYTKLRGALLKKTFDNFETLEGTKDAKEAVHKWALNVIGGAEQPPFLFLYGMTGNGKTHLSAAAANGWLRVGIPVIFSTAPEMLWMVRAGSIEDREALITTLKTIPALVIDDLGVQTETDSATETIFRIIDGRMTEELPTLISSNIPPEHIEDMRLQSRLSDKRVCLHVLNKGNDYRKMA